MSPQDGYFLLCGVVLALFSHVSGGTAVGQGIYRIVNVYTGLDLEVNHSSLADGGTVDKWSDVSGANNEHWNLMAVGDGTYRIVNVNSGLDLEDNVGTGNGSVVDQLQDNGAGSTNEFGRLTQNGDRSYKLMNAYCGLYLEDYSFQTGNGAKVDQWADNGGSNQHLEFDPEPMRLGGRRIRLTLSGLLSSRVCKTHASFVYRLS